MKCTVISNETGEIITESFNIDSLEDTMRKKKRAEKAKIHEQFKSLQDEVLGNFVFFIYKNMDFIREILNDSDLVKFMYIATFVKKEGILIKDNNTTYITKKDLFNMLKVSRGNFNKFYEKLLKNNLIKELDNKIYVNLQAFYRGSLSDYKKLTNSKMKDFVRIYIKTTRELFEQTETRKQKQLAIVYKLIPFTNYRLNILSHNINEKDIERIKPLTVAEVLEILKYDKSNISRFKSEFYSLTYKGNPIFMTLQRTNTYNESIILVNPQVYYRGEGIKDLEYLISLFNLR